MSWKNALTVSASSLEPAIKVRQDLGSATGEAPGGELRLTLLARADTLGDAVDEQIRDVVLAQVSRGEVLVVGPQPLTDLRHRCLRQQQSTGLVFEGILDVAHLITHAPIARSPDPQGLACVPSVLTDRRAERLDTAGHVRCLHHLRGLLAAQVGWLRNKDKISNTERDAFHTSSSMTRWGSSAELVSS